MSSDGRRPTFRKLRAVPAAPRPEEQTVRLPLSEIFPLLADAVQNRRTWLRDFKDEEIAISTDLYEVILAYQFCRRPGA